MKQQIIIVSTLVIFVGVILLLIFTSVGKTKKITCKAFQTQMAAQEFYDSNPKTYRYLDGNHDGKPCQALPVKYI